LVVVEEVVGKASVHLFEELGTELQMSEGLNPKSSHSKLLRNESPLSQIELCHSRNFDPTSIEEGLRSALTNELRKPGWERARREVWIFFVAQRGLDGERRLWQDSVVPVYLAEGRNRAWETASIGV
jgi:hypothetical protein